MQHFATALLAAAVVFARPQDPRPAYEAASVKLHTAGPGGSSSKGSRGQVVFTNQTLKRLIERAYDVKPFQVSGPAWLEDVRLDIAAKYPAEMKLEDRFLMLRTLLEDRLKLAAHRESRELPGYVLAVSKSGFKLQSVPSGDNGIDHEGRNGVDRMKASRVSMREVADFLERQLDLTVADRTALDGVYDFELHWTVDPTPSADPDPKGALFAALQDALGTIGLHLQPQKVPVEIVVVDYIERTPTGN